MKDTAADRIVMARSAMILDQPFFGVLSLRLKLVEAAGLLTMGTDGERLIYDPAWVDSITDAELKGVVAHEILHCSNGHPWRREHREKKKWNQACDYAINPIILASGFQLPEGGLVDDKYQGMSAEAIYAELPDEEAQSDQGEGQGEDPSEGEGQLSGWGLVLDGEEVQAEEKQQEWRVATVQALQSAKNQGSLPSELERMLGEVVRPKLPWKEILRRFVQQSASEDYSWKYPNKRFLPLGMYMPSMKSEQMPPLVVVIDTSGSISESELAEFEAEVQAIAQECKPERIHIIYCDARIHKVDTVEQGDVVIMKPVGGGGTDFRPPFEWVKEHDVTPACLIYFTDMAGMFPDPTTEEYPVLWLATTPDALAPFGETVCMR